MTNLGTRPSSRTGRSAWIEWARVASCAGIVWFHAGAPGDQVALGGLIAFTALGGAFIKPARHALDIGVSLQGRAARLLLPWVLWSVLYGALRTVEALRQGEGALAWFSPEMLLYGTWAHLWFLPFLFVATLAVQFGDLISVSKARLSTALGWSLILCTPLFVWLEYQGLGKPMDQWVSVLPALGLGILLRGVKPGDAKARKRVLSLLVVDAIALGATALLYPEYQYALTKHIVGGLVIFAWLAFSPAGAFALHLGALTLLVYLAHPLVLVLSERFLDLNNASVIVATGLTVASFVCAVVIDIGVRRLPFLPKRMASERSA